MKRIDSGWKRKIVLQATEKPCAAVPFEAFPAVSFPLPAGDPCRMEEHCGRGFLSLEKGIG